MENLGKPELMKVFIIWGAVLSCVHVRGLRVAPCPPPGLRASLELTPPPTELLLEARAAWEPWGPHGTQLAGVGGGGEVMHSRGPRPRRAGSGAESAWAHSQGAVHRGGWPGGQGCQGRVVQYPPSEGNQLHPAALPGQLDQARDGNQGWLQPSHPEAPPQAPGSSWEGSISGWMGPGQGCVWAGGQAWSKLSWKPSPCSARSTRLPGHAPHGPRGTGLPAAACSELALSPCEGTPPGPWQQDPSTGRNLLLNGYFIPKAITIQYGKTAFAMFIWLVKKKEKKKSIAEGLLGNCQSQLHFLCLALWLLKCW